MNVNDIAVKEIRNGLGETVYRYGVPSILKPGKISYCTKNYSTRKVALAAARRWFEANYGRNP